MWSAMQIQKLSSGIFFRVLSNLVVASMPVQDTANMHGMLMRKIVNIGAIVTH